MGLQDYSVKDITELRNYLVSLVDKITVEYGMTGWSDRNESDMGMVFLELAAGVTDMMNYYLDKQALENYLPTAKVRRNLKRIVNLVGYQLDGPIPGRTNGLLYLDRHFDFDFTVPKYFQVSYSRKNQGNIYYATTQDVTFKAGTTQMAVSFYQGITNKQNMIVGDIRRSRFITINNTNVADGSVVLTIGGEVWTQVRDILCEDVFGKKYSVAEDIDDRPVIDLGYQYEKFLPDDPSEPVEVKYLVTEGAHGIVSAGKLDTIEDYLEVNGYDISSHMGVTNLSNAIGGVDREDMEVARIMAPHVRHSEGRFTTREDYKEFVESMNGILKAEVIDWTVDDMKYISVPYQVAIYVLPVEDRVYEVAKDIREAIRKEMEPYLWCSMNLSIQNPTIVDIDLTLQVETTTNARNYVGLRTELSDLYEDFFKKERRSFGETFTIGQLENVAKQSNLVDSATLTSPESVISLERYEFPRLGRLDIEIVGKIR